MMKNMKNLVKINYKSNDVFQVFTTKNTTYKAILIQARDGLLKKHFYFKSIMDVITNSTFIFILLAFIRVFAM